MRFLRLHNFLYIGNFMTFKDTFRHFPHSHLLIYPKTITPNSLVQYLFISRAHTYTETLIYFCNVGEQWSTTNFNSLDLVGLTLKLYTCFGIFLFHPIFLPVLGGADLWHSTIKSAEFVLHRHQKLQLHRGVRTHDVSDHDGPRQATSQGHRAHVRHAQVPERRRLRQDQRRLLRRNNKH
jgi:hypothetical protein